jgi:hypothetical protein
MKEEQMDFLEKLGEKSEAQKNNDELESRDIAIEVMRRLIKSSPVEEIVKKVLAEHGKGLENFKRICELVKNTMIDNGGKDGEYWQR